MFDIVPPSLFFGGRGCFMRGAGGGGAETYTIMLQPVTQQAYRRKLSRRLKPCDNQLRTTLVATNEDHVNYFKYLHHLCVRCCSSIRRQDFSSVTLKTLVPTRDDTVEVHIGSRLSDTLGDHSPVVMCLCVNQCWALSNLRCWSGK